MSSSIRPSQGLPLAPVLSPAWRRALHDSVCQPPRSPRQPLLINGVRVGSVEEGILQSLPAQALAGQNFDVVHHGLEGTWQIRGAATEALQRLALALYECDVGQVRRQWRQELLAVCDESGAVLAHAERGVMRLLGLRTRAVHLHALDCDGRVWLQQRALTKATDPGLWDTLVGGMIATDETLQSALARETWEEAGLRLDQLTQLQPAGNFMVQRPNAVDGGVGYVVERIHWYRCFLPPGVRPCNQDGEVAQFACFDAAALQALLAQQALATEAMLILSDVASLAFPDLV